MIKTSKSTTRLLKGGEMMRTLILTLALALVVGGAAVADTATASIDIYSGWSIIGCPLVPVNLSTDMDVDPELDYTEPYFAWDEIASDLENYKLMRFDAPSASWKKYFADEDFGKLLLGDGYYLMSSKATTLQYEGLEDGVPYTDPSNGIKTKTDMWISLPGYKGDSISAGGQHMISTPYATDIPAYTVDEYGEPVWQIFFTDGNVIKDWYAASDPGDPNSWVSDTFYGYENGSTTTVSYNDEVNYVLKAGRGYWFKTKKDDIAMIIKAQN